MPSIIEYYEAVAERERELTSNLKRAEARTRSEWNVIYEKS